MTVCITGWRSRIAQEFRAMLPEGEDAVWGLPTEADFPRAERYLFCHGLLRSKRLEDQSDEERDQGWMVNYISTATQCDWILDSNPKARICVIGSESAYRGSYDENYAVTKLKLHLYVEGKRLRSPCQQLVCISPGIIGDAGMTTRRKDLKNLERRRRMIPKGRFLLAAEVAQLAYDLLYRHDYVTNTVIRMHGGQPPTIWAPV